MDYYDAKRAEEAGIQPGFSTRIDTEEFRAAIAASNRTYVLVLVALAVFLAPVVTFIAWLISRPSIPILLGAGFFVEVLVVVIVAFFLAKRFMGKSWDGEVTNKRRGLETTGSNRRVRPVYIIEFVTDSGRKRRYKDRSASRSTYDYLSVGDRVRYHPQLDFPFEKYDKAGDPFLICPFCGSKQVPERDQCDACGKPLLK